MSRPPGRAAGLLISLVTLTNADNDEVYLDVPGYEVHESPANSKMVVPSWQGN